MAAAQGRHRLDQRTRRRGIDQIGEHEDEGALETRGDRERKLKVRIAVARLEIEDRTGDILGAVATRAQLAADLVVEGDHPAAIAHLVGDERDGHDRVECRVQNGAVADRRR